MKLHEILGRILTDVAYRQANAEHGVCVLVMRLAEEANGESAPQERDFDSALFACTQTDTWVYPVRGPSGISRDAARSDYREAMQAGSVWRGAYGVNRRKLVRDCWRWAKERDK